MTKCEVVIYKDGFPDDFRDTMIAKFAHYWRIVNQSVMESCKLRQQALQNVHADAYPEFAEGPLFKFPEPSDAQAREAYFRRCDEICAVRNKTPKDHVMATFAGMAAISVLQAQDVGEYISQYGELTANDIFVRSRSIARESPLGEESQYHRTLRPTILTEEHSSKVEQCLIPVQETGSENKGTSAANLKDTARYTPDSLFSDIEDAGSSQSPVDGTGPNPARETDDRSDSVGGAASALVGDGGDQGPRQTSLRRDGYRSSSEYPSRGSPDSLFSLPTDGEGQRSSSEDDMDISESIAAEAPTRITRNAPYKQSTSERRNPHTRLGFIGRKYRSALADKEVEFTIEDCAVTILNSTRLYVLRFPNGVRYMDDEELDQLLERSALLGDR